MSHLEPLTAAKAGASRQTTVLLGMLQHWRCMRPPWWRYHFSIACSIVQCAMLVCSYTLQPSSGRFSSRLRLLSDLQELLTGHHHLQNWPLQRSVLGNISEISRRQVTSRASHAQQHSASTAPADNLSWSCCPTASRIMQPAFCIIPGFNCSNAGSVILTTGMQCGVLACPISSGISQRNPDHWPAVPSPECLSLLNWLKSPEASACGRCTWTGDAAVGGSWRR